MLKISLISGAVAGAVLSLAAPAFAAATPVAIRGVVSGTEFTPPVIANSPGASAASRVAASLYQSAKVCLDANDNGVCDAGETSVLTKADGSFLLAARSTGPLLAEISTTSLNNGKAVTQRMVLRAPADQVSAALINPLVPARVAISPLTTEVARIMDDDRISFESAKNNLATRLNVSADTILSDTTGASAEVLKESVLLSSRFAFAAKMVDRHDVSPAALAVDPNATGPAITMKEAQLTAMNLEGIPRYDHVFLIVLENKATSSIKGSKYAPRINAYLNAGNQFTSYYSTGNPSEPNRLAIASADDFGITDDSAFNCYPSGTTAANAIEDLPLPPGVNACSNTTNHNIKGKQNLFTALTSKGMSWRVYSESKNPGADWRKDGTADSTIVAPDYLYTADEPVGAIGTPGLQVRLASALYAAKHNGSVFFQNVRSSPEFLANNRTMGGGQWDEALKAIAPAGWNADQFGDDLASGDVGQLNILEPDQCDDMHGVTLVGTMPGSSATKAASDCSGNALIYRGDKYTDYLIKKIQASPLWNNPHKRVAIVMMFDEGTATSGFNSCCGWNTNGSPLALGPLVKNADGTVSNEVITNYKQGNKGHGTSTFGVLNNQSAAPKGVVDSDAYSHISLVRTLQDMFQLADPSDDWSYMNRSKYSQKFIAANILNLPEYAGSADAHFDAVRPMNHTYVIPAGYVQKNGYPTIKQVGPDVDQRNGWALK
ncbi:Phosphoesterase family protein [Duganella sacchari]|uniref:Phosphoesterase family protein n=1 Tax=Duganella sacchari TaxID=551987 RepID=A0A1M7R9G3_9BURK|nr:alkaline phosphatase family protein [Duganella sacchari]SHN42964.1 Phosphoesterase family protein [Duganella sacchari]